jgi:hypothetical protein
MIIRCNVCNADPDGRWKSPPTMIFRDPYREDGSKRKDPVPACRDHYRQSEKKKFAVARRTAGAHCDERTRCAVDQARRS